MSARVRMLPELLGVVVFGFVLYWVMLALEGRLEPGSALPSFEPWLDRVSEPFYFFLWFLKDITEAEFYASVLGAVGILLFAFLAYLLDQRRSRWRGYPISYGTGLWPWILAATLIGLVISVGLWGSLLLPESGWIPTFVPFVSVPAGIVFIYGRGWRIALTGAVLGALITFPIAYLLIITVLNPLELPGVIGNVTGMWLGGAIAFEICRYLPWLRQEEGPPEGEEIPETDEATDLPEPPPAVDTTLRGWFSRRVLADFSEAQFYGNELASAGLLLGTLLSWVLNPLHPALGSGFLPAILLSQTLASSVGIFLYYERWRDLEWYPTFVPVVSVAPAAVLAYGGTMQSILLGALLGAVAGAPVAQFVIDRLPNHWHLYVGNTFSMAFCTLIIVPTLSLLPGF